MESHVLNRLTYTHNDRIQILFYFFFYFSFCSSFVKLKWNYILRIVLNDEPKATASFIPIRLSCIGIQIKWLNPYMHRLNPSTQQPTECWMGDSYGYMHTTAHVTTKRTTNSIEWHWMPCKRAKQLYIGNCMCE